MKKKIFIPVITLLLLVVITLSGCQSGGISAEEYNDIVRQLNEANLQISGLQVEKATLESARDSAEDDLEAAEAIITELQIQISGMTGQYDLTGENTLETVMNIIEYYHDTHIYSKADLFVCSDMSMEVWNMLKARGINALIVVGDIDIPMDDILLSDHAWVLAEINDGQYLALETTGGYAVYKADNELYYQGWYFESPADMKSYNALIKEYNIRVEIVNQLIVEDQAVVAEHNASTNPSEAAKLKAVHDMLDKLITAQEVDLLAVEDEINGLATRCNA